MTRSASYPLPMADAAAPTELAGVAEAPTEWAQAWALDYDDYEVATRRFTPRRVTDAALAGCLVLIGAAGVVAVLGIRGVWHVEAPVAAPEPAATTTQPAATTTVRAQPPGPWITPTRPITVTAAAPPPVTVQAPPPMEQLPDYDSLLIVNLRARGWAVWNRPLLLQQAHWICAMLQDGENGASAAQQLTGYPATDAQTFVSTAMLTYPNCP